MVEKGIIPLRPREEGVCLVHRGVGKIAGSWCILGRKGLIQDPGLTPALGETQRSGSCCERSGGIHGRSQYGGSQELLENLLEFSRSSEKLSSGVSTSMGEVGGSQD